MSDHDLFMFVLGFAFAFFMISGASLLLDIVRHGIHNDR